MKKIFIILSVAIIFNSCNPKNEENQNTQTMNPNDIRINEIVHDSLTTNQLEKIKKIQLTFEEVEGMTLEESINNFKRDLNPDNEIDIWLQMADAYEKYLNSKNNKLDLKAKKEVYKLILSRSMMSDNEAIANSNLIILTEKDAIEVLSYYTATPDPIDIVKKP